MRLPRPLPGRVAGREPRCTRFSRRFTAGCLLALAAAGCGPEAPNSRGREEIQRLDEYYKGEAVVADSAVPPPTASPDSTHADEPAASETAEKPLKVSDARGEAAPRMGSCDPNYSACVPIDSDVDCEGGNGNGPSYVRGPVRVIGTDIYGLDRDGDGVACDR